MACEIAGVGVGSSLIASITSTLLAASTSSALAHAGADSACVSTPMNSGPAIPAARRWSHRAWVIASTCHSLYDPSKAEPRWPDVPKATRCAGTVGSGRCE